MRLNCHGKEQEIQLNHTGIIQLESCCTLRNSNIIISAIGQNYLRRKRDYINAHFDLNKNYTEKLPEIILTHDLSKMSMDYQEILQENKKNQEVIQKQIENKSHFLEENYFQGIGIMLIGIILILMCVIYKFYKLCK